MSTDRSYLYMVGDPVKRFKYNKIMHSSDQSLPESDQSFLQIVDGSIYEFSKSDTYDEYIPNIIVRESDVQLIIKSTSSTTESQESKENNDYNTKSRENASTAESNEIVKEIKHIENQIKGDEQINDAIADNSQYPLLLAARLAFNEFKEKAKRIQILKLLFQQKLKKKNNINTDGQSITTVTAVDELLKTQDNDKNNVLHLLVKGFDKNASVQSTTDTTATIDTPATTPTDDYIAKVTEFRNTLRDLMVIPTITPDTSNPSNPSPIIENALQRIVNASSRTNITALNEKNGNGDTPYDLFLDHYSSTPFETKNKSILGLTQISIALNETSRGESTPQPQPELDKLYEEIIDLLKPDKKPDKKESESASEKDPTQPNRQMYYAYGKTADIKTTENYDTITLINPTYHEFIKINKRLHSIKDKAHYDLTSYNGDYTNLNVSQLLKDFTFDNTKYPWCAIGFYIEEGIVEPPIILDLFLYKIIEPTSTAESI